MMKHNHHQVHVCGPVYKITVLIALASSESAHMLRGFASLINKVWY